MYWILSIIPSVLLLLLFIVIHSVYGSWLIPSAFFALYWGSLLVLVLVLFPFMDMWPPAVWLILAAASVFHIGVVTVVPKNHELTNNSDDCREYGIYCGKQIIILSFLAGIASVLVLVHYIGYPVYSLLNPKLIIEIGLRYASRRYGLGLGTPLFSNLLNVFLYLGAIYGGMWLVLAPKKEKYWSFGPLFIGLLQAFLVNARTNFIWMLAFFISGYLVASIFAGHELPLFSKQHVISVAILIVGFVFLYFVLQIFRESGGSGRHFSKTVVSMLTPPFLFSVWLKQHWGVMTPALGVKTFGGLADLLGLSHRQPGLGWEGMSVVYRSILFKPNVYTAFRQIIEDTTLLGVLPFFLVLGIVSGMSYHKIKQGKSSWIPILILFYAVTLGSYLANMLNYNTILFAWLLFVFLVSFGKWRCGKPYRR